MGTYFSMFDTTAANLAADLRTAILNSTDWSRPNAASLPNLVKATTTAGAEMVVQLDDAAVTSKQMQLGVYRTHDGTTGVDKMVRYLVWRIGVTGVSGDPLHVIVSAGKDHLYFSVEGPAFGEPNPEDSASNTGSNRQAFFLGAISPYFAADTVPAVCSVSVEASQSAFSATAYVSRNQADTASWVPARLATLQPPVGSVIGRSSPMCALQRVASDGATYLWPYVVAEDVAGLRGRLAKCHFAGFNIDGTSTNVLDPIPAVFSRVDYSGDTYMLVTPNKGTTRSGSSPIYQAFGAVLNNPSGDGSYTSPVIAIPS